MKPVRLTNHAREQAIERGTNLEEIIDTIITGNRQPAKNSRYKYQATFQYNNDWQGRFYSLKKVVPIVAETDTELVVITVYTFYL
ncbi:MAG: DUF4258 domain-containing protein [Oscillatoriales cyanobacterium RU_3_3]|nr:DUF4258 domain-containing protein [Microcoleus sp. SU_5_6]NJL66513.1 DUF4258 domain-containing protein [Microcoleus sp. SM1_3_4]NJM60497.1 DUF4258 domain-containing protein [Oscillatoriales cyanobacterium RU_3_3]NJR24137.1 DUF4258 domain-containing protein [Richelia sp. CSU_2_1]